MVNLGGATENDRKKIVITKDSKAFFHNNVDYCVGTGRMGLALTEEYQEELRLVQKEIGFKHIRGHGLFCDDMAIFQTYEEDGKVRVEYAAQQAVFPAAQPCGGQRSVPEYHPMPPSAHAQETRPLPGALLF